MKKNKLFILILLLLLLFPMTTKAVSYDEATKVIQEVMKSYYVRGTYLQYNSPKYGNREVGRIDPEEATSQDNNYLVCIGFVNNVYGQAFGFPVLTYYVDKTVFMTSTANLLTTAKELNSKDSMIVYYGTNTSNSVFGDKDALNKLKIGDLLVYTGHVMLVYDFEVSDGKRTDAILLEANLSPYISSSFTDGTSGLSYNINNSEGAVKKIRLSGQSRLYDSTSNNFKCQYSQCAVIRLFDSDSNGNAVFKFDVTSNNNKENFTLKYNKSKKRVSYPGLSIEKTVDVGDNNVVNVGDELTYKIKVTNKSDFNNIGNEATYGLGFKVQEVLSENVEYISSTQGGINENNKVNWIINTKLSPNESVELTYKVRVKDDLELIGEEIVSEGKFDSSTFSDASITTGTVKNKIVPKVTNYKDSYSNCYNSKKASYSGLKLINEIYNCSLGKDFKFNDFNFENLFKKSGTRKADATINFVDSSNLDQNHKNFKNMILNNYFNGNVSDSVVDVTSANFYLPLWGSNSVYRSKTINSQNFKDGDVLIYEMGPLGRSKRYTTEDGLYAYIYIESAGGFVGINGSSTTIRNKFTYDYYSSDITTNLYNSTDTIVLDFANYQTLFDKDNYVILRPELVVEEIINVNLVKPTKTNYIQNYEGLDLSNGYLEVTYNNGKIDTLNLDDTGVTVTGFNNTKVGTKTITVTYMGYQKTFNVEIISKQSTKLELLSLPTKTNYIQGYEKLDLTGGLLKVTYNDKTTDEIDLTNENIKTSGFDNSKVGTITITVEYDGLNTSFNVQIISKQLSGISISKNPTKTAYIQNYENLDLTGGLLKVIYSDTSTDEIDLKNENITISGFDNTKVGTNTVTVTYQGKTTIFTVEILSKQIEKIEMLTRPLKENYIQNYEKLDLTGGVLKVTYNDKTTDEISLENEKVKISGFDNSKAGTNTITVEYEGYGTSFNVTIVKKKIKSITMITLPSKTTYIQNYERLDVNGGVLKVTYDDTSTDEISLTNENVKTSGFDNTKAGTNTVTVTYEGKTTTFTVEILSKQIEKIEMLTKPLKENYIQNYEKLDLYGGVLKVTYNDKTTDEISLGNENVKTSGFNNTKIGTNTIAVEYEGKTTTFTVNIISKQSKGIQLISKPVKINYIQNYEKLDLSGGIIKVIYDDNSTDEMSLKNENIIIEGFDNSKIGTNTVTIKYREHVVKFDVEIISKQSIKIEIKKLPDKIEYSQNKDELTLDNGILNVIYNDETIDEISLTNEKVKISGFDNSKVGTNTITVEYEGHMTTFDIEIISGEGYDNPGTGPLKIIIILGIFVISIIMMIRYRKKINNV